MDRVDKKILNELQFNSQISNLELAQKVALSPSPCLRRVKQLEEQGYIERHVALLNPDKVGLPLSILVSVGLSSHCKKVMQEFESAVSQLDEVVQCFLITGQSADYMLRVVVPDLPHYQRFLLDKLTSISGVSNVQSSFILNRVVDKTQLPLSYL